MMRYQSYSIEDFLAEETFQQYCSGSDAAATQYWEDILREQPEIAARFREAEKYFHLLNGRQGNLHRQTERLLVRLVEKLEVSAPAPVRRLFRPWMAAAASIVLILLVGYFYFSQSGDNTDQIVQSAEAVTDILPGSNKATLTLADGTQIVLDSAHTGAITKQGNVTIIKLNDGLLSYDPNSTSLSPPHGGGSTFSTSPEIKYNTITTPRGGQYQLVLADGSKVWLNAASSLRFPNIFPGKDRRVELTGEGYFEIAHNAEKPFYVEVGDMEVKVLGTHFNVNAYADEPNIRTTLLEGSVQVSYDSNSKKIVPGEQAQINNNGEGKIHVAHVDVYEAVAWKNGKFIFNNANINSIMRQLEKWYNIEVVYENYDNSELFMGSISRNVNCSEILSILEKTGSLRFEIRGNSIIVK